MIRTSRAITMIDQAGDAPIDVNDTTAESAARMIPSTRPCPENNMIAALICSTPMISHAQPQN